MRDQVSWHGWTWDPQIDCQTHSGSLLHRLTSAMSATPDIRECGLLIFGSSPLEFGLGIALNSGDIDITPDQLYPIFGTFLKNNNLLSGNPHVQLCPPGLFRPGQMWPRRAVNRTLNEVEVLLPHPIDIIAGKLHRLDERDYQGIQKLIDSTGRPTSADMLTYAKENPDWLLSEGAVNEKVVDNFETFYSFLGGKDLDVREDILKASLFEYKSVTEEDSLAARLLASSRIIDAALLEPRHLPPPESSPSQSRGR